MDPRERRRQTIKQIEEERRAKTGYDLLRIQLKRLEDNIVGLFLEFLTIDI